jgi:regulatory factor X 1/2/3
MPAALFCPVTVQWLLENYETKSGVSLPRSTVYNHYIRHCKSHEMEPVNAASFGKLIRSIFLGLQTRRLGTRGNSKYHYYGIQIKPESLLNDVHEPESGSQSDSDKEESEKRVPEDDPLDVSKMVTNSEDTSAEIPPLPEETSAEPEDLLEELVSNLYVNCRMEPESYLKFAAPSPTYREVREIAEWQKDIRLITKFTCDPQRIDLQRKIQIESTKFGKSLPKVDYRLSSDVLSRSEVENVRTSDRLYCELLIKSSVLYKFDTLLRNCHQYWSGFPVLKRTLSFSKNKLKSISENENLRLFIETVDSQVYQVIVDLLFPNVIHPIPVIVLDVVRNFALKFANSVAITMEDYPEALKRARCFAAEAFAQIILDSCRLNMIAESVRPLFEEAHRAKAYRRLKELNIPAALSVSIYPIANEDKYFYLVETYRQALANMKSLENYSEWLYTEVDKFTCNFKNQKDEPKFEEQAKSFAKDMSYILYVICSQMAYMDTEVNTFFTLLQLFTNNYIMHLIQEKRSALRGMTGVQYSVHCLTLLRD